jgi:glycosyltransferase involved in cell wall biosynthesis
MKVSVLINSYNGSQYIKKSVSSVLRQSFKDFEIVFIDDGSTDDTEGVIKDIQKDYPCLKYYKSEKNLGIYRIQDKGLRLCVGEYIAKLDVDDE